MTNQDRDNRPSPRRSGFTLIELLVVVAIIVALLAILMPSMGKAIEVSNRAVCGSNLKQFSVATLAGAVERKGLLPDWHNDSGEWGTSWVYTTTPNAHTFDSDARDFMLETLGFNRDMFYCPSNHDELWNRDDFWEHGGGRSVWGYTYFGNAPKGHALWVYAEGTSQPFAHRISDNPMYKVLWADNNRQIAGVGWYRFDVARGSNHFDTSIEQPDGSNEAFMDGHVEWVNFKDMAPEMTRGGWQFWW